jgi:hypothetical protein
MKYKFRYMIDGREVSKAEFSKRKKRGLPNIGSATYSAARPLEGVAMAVHPNQVDAARERVKALGLSGVDYKPDGTIVFSSKGQCGRAGFLKAMQMHDNNSFF